MTKAQPMEFFLTCGSWQEAQRIADELLDKKLIACAEFFEVKSKFHWQDHLEEAKEIKLIMHSAEHLFDQIEAVVKSIHSYDTFVLQSVPVSWTSAEAKKWLEETVHG